MKKVILQLAAAALVVGIYACSQSEEVKEEACTPETEACAPAEEEETAPCTPAPEEEEEAPCSPCAPDEEGDEW